MTQLLKIYIALVMLICFPSSVLAFQVYYYDTDATGSPIAVVDTNGNQVWKGEYYPFGEERNIQGTPESNNRRLIGKEKDDETGLTYFDARYMNAGSGRFLTPDPVRPVDEFTSETQYALLTQPQRLNRYAYGLNNPYRYVDPDGQTVWDVVDYGFFCASAYSMVVDPSWGALATLAWDTIALAPVVPSTGVIREAAALGAKAIGSSKRIDIDLLSQAGKAIDPADKGGKLTKAGRAIDKHGAGARPGNSKFPTAKGSPQMKNAIGQNQLDDILTHPNSKFEELGRGGTKVTAPDGRGARFDSDGTFSGFVE